MIIELSDVARDYPEAWRKFNASLPQIEEQHEELHGERIKLRIAGAVLNAEHGELVLSAIALDMTAVDAWMRDAGAEPYHVVLQEPVSRRTH